MSTPSTQPRANRPGRPDVFTNYLQHSLGLCQLFESVEQLPSGATPIPMTHGPRFTFPGVPPRPPAPGSIDVTRLTKVLEVNPVAGTVEVQGWCTMADLVTATSRFGLLPAVIDPRPDRFVADSVARPTAGATSFREGPLADAVMSLDVLTGERLLRTAEPGGEFADLFEAFGHSAGRLGLATKVTLRLIPAKAFVLARAERFTDPAAWLAALDNAAHGRWAGGSVDLLEARFVAPAEASVIVGTFIDAPSARRLAAAHGIPAPSAGLAGPGRAHQVRQDPPFALYRTADFLFRYHRPARPARAGHAPAPMAGPYRLEDVAARREADGGTRLYPLREPGFALADAPPAGLDPVPSQPVPAAVIERYDPSGRFQGSTQLPR